VYGWYCELLLESSVVAVELALQVCCNFRVGDNTFCRFWRGGVVLPKGFSPPANLGVSVFSLSVCFCMHDWLNIIVHIISNL
jgi:hypothetical protein